MEGDIDPTIFHSEIGVNLEATDKDKLYDEMVGTILENMATCQSMYFGPMKFT